MKNIKTKAIAATLSALMAVSAVGATTVCAAETTTQEKTNTYYFVDNKDWGTASCYAWEVTEDGTAIEESAFPGEELTAVGTTDIIDGTTHTVYEVEVKASDDYFVVCQGTDHGQQSNDIKNNLFRDGANMIYLSRDNYAEFRHFNPEDIQPLTTVASTRQVEETRTYYFVDNKDWGTANCYAWDVKEDGTVVEESSFPGTKLEAIGTTDVVDGKTHTVYEVEVKTSDDYFIVCQGTDHGQQSDDINNHLFRDGANMIYLSRDNYAEFTHFNPEDIQPLATVASARQVENTRTVYFINNKNWSGVNAYFWSTQMVNNEDGTTSSAPVESSNCFPGFPAKVVGSTTMLGANYDLYKVEVPTTADAIIFSEAGESHPQQSSNIDLTRSYNGANVFYLDNNNQALVRHLDETQVKYN